MSEETNGHGTGKPYAEMTPAERSRLMDFIVTQQAQFFADITEIKAVLADLLTVNAKHERRLERAENILRSAVVIGQRTRTELRTQGRTNQEEIAQLIQVQAHNEALAQRNGEQIAALRENQAETAALVQRTGEQMAVLQATQEAATHRHTLEMADLRATVGDLAALLATLAQRTGGA